MMPGVHLRWMDPFFSINLKESTEISCQIGSTPFEKNEFQRRSHGFPTDSQLITADVCAPARTSMGPGGPGGYPQ